VKEIEKVFPKDENFQIVIYQFPLINSQSVSFEILNNLYI